MKEILYVGVGHVLLFLTAGLCRAYGARLWPTAYFRTALPVDLRSTHLRQNQMQMEPAQRSGTHKNRSTGRLY
jgi:thiamine monophosphate synthase